MTRAYSEERAEYMRKWMAEHRAQYLREYSERNRERLHRAGKEWREAHRAEKAAMDRAYAQAHREKINEYCRRYRKSHPNSGGATPSCLVCGKVYRVSPSVAKKCKTCSVECRCKWISANFVGAASHSWRGGVTPRSFRRTYAYKNWRRSVFERDARTCQWCGDDSTELHAHHVRPCHKDVAARLDVNNGVTLCGYCHNLTKMREAEFEPYLAAIVQKQPPRQLGSYAAASWGEWQEVQEAEVT